MTATERGSTFLALLREMASDPSIVEELVAAARAQSPEVARLPPAENRRHISVLLAAGLASFERAGDPSARDFAEATRLGADRAAQGVPISGLLSGVQAGRTRALEIAIERGRKAGIPDDVLLEVMLDLDRYTGALEQHVISGYHAAERELARSHWEARTLLLRRLLLGERPEPSGEELARWGLRRDGRYHCVVSDSADPVLWGGYRGVFGAVDGRSAGLAAHVPSGAGQVAPGVPGSAVSTAPGVPASAAQGQPGVPASAAQPAPRLAASAAQAALRVPASAASVAPISDLSVIPPLYVWAPACALPDLPAVYALTVAAFEAARDAGLHGPRTLVDLAGETALAAQPLLAGLLSAELLGALKPGDEFHRELASTALSYLDHGQRLDHTAAALHVHPNTVRYRLRRLQEITGLPSVAAEPGERLTVLETVRLWWALRTWLR